jgi:DNA-damage-inducible protein J
MDTARAYAWAVFLNIGVNMYKFIDNAHKIHYNIVGGDIMSTTNLNLRVDSDVKSKVEVVLNDMGLNFTTAVNIYFKQILRTGEIPFKIKVDLPNEETIRAMEETEALLKSPNTKYYDSAKALFEDIEGTDDV